MIALCASITACSTTHFVALSNDTHAALNRCERPQPISDAWLACKDEACRRANELPTLTDNARKHHACADIIDRVRTESDRVRALND